MNGIKLLLITSVTFVALYFFIRLRNSLFDLILLLLMLGAAIYFILFPSVTNQLANKLGVGRGADLIFYISIIIFWFVILKLYARIRRLENSITELIRKESLNSEKNLHKPE